jgi:glycosyltransferase involved in cell wall biosynthesis
MKNQPLVSVIIPTYNRAGVICRTIKNVLEQTHQNLEVIVVDDGSTDETQARLEQYGERIRIITQSNAGPAAARNRGIEAACGKIIAFQDSDDIWLPTKLERQVALLERVDTSIPCCICNATLRFSDARTITSFEDSWLFPPCEEGIWTNVAEVLSTRFVLFCQTVAIRREVVERIGGFDETLKFLEDYDLPLRLALEGPWAFIREPLVVWHQGSGGSWSRKAMVEHIHTKECEVRIRKNLLVRVGEKAQYESVRKHLRRELNRNRVEQWLARLELIGFPGSSILCSLLRTLERYLRAIYRRSPLYPRLEVKPVHTGSGR